MVISITEARRTRSDRTVWHNYGLNLGSFVFPQSGVEPVILARIDTVKRTETGNALNYPALHQAPGFPLSSIQWMSWVENSPNQMSRIEPRNRALSESARLGRSNVRTSGRPLFSACHLTVHGEEVHFWCSLGNYRLATEMLSDLRTR